LKDLKNHGSQMKTPISEDEVAKNKLNDLVKQLKCVVRTIPWGYEVFIPNNGQPIVIFSGLPPQVCPIDHERVARQMEGLESNV